MGVPTKRDGRADRAEAAPARPFGEGGAPSPTPAGMRERANQGTRRLGGRAAGRPPPGDARGIRRAAPRGRERIAVRSPITTAAKRKRFDAWGLLERRAWLLQWPDAALAPGRNQSPTRPRPVR
ncbi:MAG: hypothetical protein Kow0054_25980 [Deferrisoma sp.]